MQSGQFDDVPPDTLLTNYSSASWLGFTSDKPASQAAVPHLAPYSPNQTAIAPSGTGTIVFGTTAYGNLDLEPFGFINRHVCLLAIGPRADSFGLFTSIKESLELTVPILASTGAARLIVRPPPRRYKFLKLAMCR